MSILNYLITLSSSKLRQKFKPLQGVPRLLPVDVNETCNGVLEPSVIVDDNNIKIYFTRTTGQEHVICLATTNDMEGDWVIAENPVIGMGYGGAPLNRRAHCSHVIKKDGFYYCYATNGYGEGLAGEDRCIYLYKSSDGIVFEDLGLFLNITAIAGNQGYGNVSVYPEKVNGKYEMLVEARFDVWKIFRFTSDNIDGNFVFQNSLVGLQIHSGSMYGGMHHFFQNNKWHIIYHYGEAGNLPTVLGYATSDNLDGVEVKEKPVFGLEAKPYFDNTDQLADPYIIEANGKCYLLAEYCTNTTFNSQMWMWTFDGKLEDLLA